MVERQSPAYPEDIFDDAELMHTEQTDVTITELYFKNGRLLVRDIFEFEGQVPVERLRMFQPTDRLGWEINKRVQSDWRLLHADEYEAEALRLERMAREA